MIHSRRPVVYRMDAIHRWILCGGAVLICVVPLVGAVDPSNGYQLLPGIIATAMVSPIAMVLVWLSRRSRLELSDRGLSVSKLGFSVQVGWADIERIGAEPSVQGVVLKLPSNQLTIQRESRMATRSSFDASNYSAYQLQLMREQRFIELKSFARLLRTAEFSKAVAPYAVAVTGASMGD